MHYNPYCYPLPVTGRDFHLPIERESIIVTKDNEAVRCKIEDRI